MLSHLTDQAKRNPIATASAGIMGIALGAKVLGYLEKVVLAYYFGTGYQVDVYNTVVAIVLSVFIFFREVVEPGFLNSFMAARQAGDPQGAWSLFNKTGRWLLLVTVALTGLVLLYPEAVVDVFAGGFTGEKRELCIRLTRLAFPACIFLSLSALTGITLNGLKQFALPASGDLAFKVVVLAALLGLYHWWGVYAAFAGLVAGAAVKLLVHLLALRKHLTLGSVAVKPAYVSNAWKLTWPLLLGITFSQVNTLVDNLFASYLQEGAISALSYSKKVVELPVLVFPYVLSIVVFPYFSEMAQASDRRELTALLAGSLRLITLVFVPLSIFFFTFPLEIVELIFKRGAFSQESAVLTARPLAFYALGMVFFAIETVLVIFYYANANTRTPILVGMGCVVGNLAVTYGLVNTIGYAGIALGLVLAKGAKVTILLVLLKDTIRIHYGQVGGFLRQLVPAGALLTLTLLGVVAAGEGLADSPLQKALRLGVALLVGGSVYAATLWMLHVRTARQDKKRYLRESHAA